MQRLLYHAPDNPNQESPFDRAILQVVQGQEASIVSPYIGLQYLQRLISLSASWRLISDVLEWLSATPSKERSAVYEFLKENEGLVHHYPAIHAKTVVSRAPSRGTMPIRCFCSFPHGSAVHLPSREGLSTILWITDDGKRLSC